MKRNCVFIIFTILCLCVLALRVYSGNLSSFIGGQYVAYDGQDREYVPALIASSYERIDINGGKDRAVELIGEMSARVVKTEKIEEDIDIYYWYSPRLIKNVYLFGEKVNLMIAVRGDRISVGTPLLKGSY